MGGNCSPLIADLFLLNCEYQFMSKIVKSKKLGLAKLLSMTSRYIDDLCVINYRHFATLISDIYPSDLEVNRNGVDNKLVEYLDVSVSVTPSGISTSVFHKVDSFPFPVILLTFPDSLIPYRMGVNVFAGQVIRYMRICSNINDLIKKVNKTVNSLSSRGYRTVDLQVSMENLVNRYPLLLAKFGLFRSRQLTNLCDSFR